MKPDIDDIWSSQVEFSLKVVNIYLSKCLKSPPSKRNFHLLYQIYTATHLKAPPPFDDNAQKKHPPPLYIERFYPPTFWPPQTRLNKKIL